MTRPPGLGQIGVPDASRRARPNMTPNRLIFQHNLAFTEYIHAIFGTLPEDLIGLGGADWLHEKRRRTIAQLQINTAKIIVNLLRPAN